MGSHDVNLMNMTIDWALLREQKRMLFEIMRDSPGDARLLDGLLTLLDEIQDLAAQQLGKDAVFGSGDPCAPGNTEEAA